MKWAQELEERKFLIARYTAGKCKGLMEELKWDDISAMTRESTMVFTKFEADILKPFQRTILVRLIY